MAAKSWHIHSQLGFDGLLGLGHRRHGHACRSTSAEVRALAKRVAGFHSGFVADAATSAAKIVQGGIAYAFQVGTKGIFTVVAFGS